MSEIVIAAPEIEELVLGVLLADEEALAEVETVLTPEMFYVAINRRIYAKMVELDSKGLGYDLFTISQELQEELKDLGGSVYLVELMSKIASSFKVREHAMIIREKFIMRNTSRGLAKVIGKIQAGEDPTDVIHEANKVVDEMNDLVTGGSGELEHIAIIAEKALVEAEKRQVAYDKGEKTAITTGLRELDRKLAGWHNGELTILAARPSIGKSLCMLQMALAAAQQGVPVCVYSLEMSDVSLANRMLLSESGVDPDAFRRGAIDREDWIRLQRAQAMLSRLPIYIDSNPVVSMRYISAHTKQMKKKGQCGMILIDYLQLADMGGGKNSENREQEVSRASRQAKILSKELNVPVILLSQLSRKVEERADKMPVLSDLRESGGLENNADNVIFIHRPAYYKQAEIETSTHGIISSVGVGMFNVAKQREGSVGIVLFRHNESLNRIMDYESA